MFRATLTSIRLAVAGLLLFGATAFASVDSIGTDTKATIVAGGTAAIVTGSIVCSVGDTFSVTAIVQQLENHGVDATGQGISGEQSCTGAPQPFAVTVTILIPATATFKKGPASLIFSANSTNISSQQGDGSSQTLTAKVQLAN
jgi:hypothetical protein